MENVIQPRELRFSAFFSNLEELVQSRREVFLDFIRIYLGLGLIAKGVYFLYDQAFMGQLLLSGKGLDISAAFLSHYIPLAHLAGGALLAVGFLTRFAALIQLPVLFGAVFFVHLQEGLFTRGQSLEFAALVLFLLLLYAVCGAGKLSIDNYLKSQRAPQAISNLGA